MGVARTHRPVWQKERCMPCRACAKRCPSHVFTEQALEEDSLRSQVVGAHVFSRAWEKGVAACQSACPLGQDVPAYLRAIAKGDFDTASAVVYRSNPLPSVCGRLCPAACMQACVRSSLDKAVEIRSLKRAAVELANRRPTLTPAVEKEQIIYVIGSGPAGLAASYFLRKRGYQVQLLEAEAEPGGLLRYAIGEFDLPKSLLAQEIETLLATGIRLETSRRIESLQEVQELARGPNAAVVLATGATRSRLNIAGQDLDGCCEALPFARRFAHQTAERLQGPAVIYGSGEMALACARMAARAGAKPIHWVMRRSQQEAAVGTKRMEQAMHEGISFVTEMRPVGLLGQQHLERVKLLPVIYGRADERGRRWPQTDFENMNTTRTIEARWFVAADHRRPDLSFMGEAATTLSSRLGSLRVDPDTLATPIDNVFAAGDVVTLGRNVVEAIALGMRVSVAIDAHFRGVVHGQR